MKKIAFLKTICLVVLIIVFAFLYSNIQNLSYDNFNFNMPLENSIKLVNNKIEETEKLLEKRVSIVAVGDALIHSSIYQDAYIGNNSYDFSDMFEYIGPMIKDYDLKYYNQETIIGGKDLGVSHYPRFNSPDEIALNLIDIGFNIVSLANNHSLDKGEAGILHSVDFWKGKDVVVNGQSDSFQNRDNIDVHEINGIKYAFLAYTDGTNGIPLPSGKEYLVNIYSNEQAKKDIDSIKDKVDLIIVSMHWGNEYTHIPNDRQREEAKFLSDLGVNLIIGSHPHVIQPVEYIGDTLVIYSLGNFISAQHPLGLDKIIGLMVGVDIVIKDSKVTFENIDYNLLYTYCTSDYRNYKVIPFKYLDDSVLPNYKEIEEEYLNIVMGGEQS